MKIVSYLCLALSLPCAIMLSGCASPELVSSTMQSAQEFITSGMTNEAVQVLSEALDDKHLDESGQAKIFSSLLRLTLIAGREKEAKDLYMQAVSDNQPRMLAASGIITGFYRYHGKTTNLLEWTRVLMDTPLPKDISTRAAAAHANTLYSTKQIDALITFIPTAIEKYQADTRTVLTPLIRDCIRKKMVPLAGRILDTVDQNAGSNSSLLSMAAAFRCHWLASQSKIADADQHFMKTAALMTESDALYAFDNIASQAITGRQWTDVDRLCHYILTSQKDKTTLIKKSASLWVRSASASGRLAEVPKRLNELLKMEIPVTEVFSAYKTSFYAVLQRAGKDDQLAMLSISDTLAPLLSDEDMLSSCRTLKLDGAFLMNNFDMALEVIESGIPAKDKDWHLMATIKIKAHKALHEGRKQDAVKHFRDFMEIIKDTDSKETDPSTELLHTVPMTLGFNEKRIAELLLSDNDIPGALAACAQAKIHYEQALSDLKNMKKETAFNNEQLKAIAVLKKKIEDQSAAKTTEP